MGDISGKTDKFKRDLGGKSDKMRGSCRGQVIKKKVPKCNLSGKLGNTIRGPSLERG